MICYAFSEDGKTLVAKAEDTDITDGFSVQLQLASEVNYKLLFWAYAVDNEGKPIHALPEDGVLRVDYSKINPNDDSADAFYWVENFTGGGANKTVTLQRPFAQINVGADDAQYKGSMVTGPFNPDDEQKPIYAGTYGSGTYTSISGSAYESINLLTNEVGNLVSFTSKRNAIETLYNKSFPVIGKNKYTNMMYLIAGPDGLNSDVTFQTYSASRGGAPKWTVEVPSVPLKTNHRTNIYGSLITSKTKFNITIEKDFSGTSVTSADELQLLVNNNPGTTEVVLSKDLAGQQLTLPASEEPKTIVIYLNHKTLPETTVERNQTLKIYDYSDLKKAAPAQSARTRSAGTLLDVKRGGAVEIYDGTYTCPAGGSIITAEEGASVKIFKGTFKGQDISQYVDENSVCIPNADGSVYVMPMQICSTADQLVNALKNANDQGKIGIKVVEDMTIPDYKEFVLENVDLTLTVKPGKTLTINEHTGRYFTIYVLPSAKLTMSGNFNAWGNMVCIKGEGVMNNCNVDLPLDCDKSWLPMIGVFGGKLTVNGGRYNSNANTIINSGTLILNGGVYTTESPATDNYAILQCWYNEYYYGDTTNYYSKGSVYNPEAVYGPYGAFYVTQGDFVIKGGDFYTTHADSKVSVNIEGSSDAINGVIEGGNFWGNATVKSLSVSTSGISNVTFKGGFYSNKGVGGALGSGYTWRDYSSVSTSLPQIPANATRMTRINWGVVRQ